MRSPLSVSQQQRLLPASFAMQPLAEFLASECSLRGPSAFFHVIPAPLERSVSYGGGTAFGPAAILEASQQLEAWDGQSEPMELGIHTRVAIDCSGDINTVLSHIEATVREVLQRERMPVLLGGEHTVSLGVLRAFAKIWSGNIGVIQIDAHADLRPQYEGDPHSHACVMRRVVDELALPLFQFGVRALCREEHEFRAAHPQIWRLDAADLWTSGMLDQPLPADFPELVYLSVDVDGFDPSVIRATGTPIPGGPTWPQALLFIQRALRGRRLLGFDVVELAPQPQDHASSFATALLVYTIMGYVHRAQRRQHKE